MSKTSFSALTRILCFCLLCFLFLTLQAPGGETGKLRVVVPEAEIRLKPDTESLIIKKLPMGILLSYEEKIDGWYRVALPPDENGFVVKGYILADSVEIFIEKTESAEPEKKEPAPPKQPEQPEPRRAAPPPQRRPVPPPPPPPSAEKRPSGTGLGFSLSGGMGYLLDGGGDLESTRMGRENYSADIAALTGFDTATSTFNWSKLSFVPNFNVDIFFKFTKNFGIGFGSGFLSASSKGDYSFSLGEENVPEWWGSYDYLGTLERTRDYKITAIPLNLNFYLFLPMDGMVFSVKAGIGYYLGKLKHEDIFDYEENYEDDSWFYLNYKYIWTVQGTTNEEATCNALGFNGSLGLDLQLSPSVFFGLELFGRFVNFKNWEGTYTYSETDTYKDWIEGFGWFPEDVIETNKAGSGTLWHYKSEIDLTGKTYDYMWMETTKPSDPDDSDVRKAAVNLNALGLRLSLKFFFDLF